MLVQGYWLSARGEDSARNAGPGILAVFNQLVTYIEGGIAASILTDVAACIREKMNKNCYICTCIIFLTCIHKDNPREAWTLRGLYPALQYKCRVVLRQPQQPRIFRS